MVWRRELSSSETFLSMAADPLDCRRLCLSGAAGTLALVTLTDPQVTALLFSCCVTCRFALLSAAHLGLGILLCFLSTSSQLRHI